LSYVAILTGLALMRFPPRPAPPARGMLHDLQAGMIYLTGHQRLRALVLLALVPLCLGTPYMTLLTVFASDVLYVGGSGLGLLTACAGVGAVAGAISLAARDHRGGRTRLMLGGLVCYGLALLVFSLSHWFWVSAVLLLGVGASQQFYMTLNKMIIQEEVDEQYRGRVLSILFLDRSIVPLGTMLAGLGTAVVGVQATLAVMAVLMMVLALAAPRLLPARQATAVPGAGAR
jgi:hypothetical protein